MAEEYNRRFLATTKITKPFPVAVKMESNQPIKSSTFSISGHVSEGSQISALMCCWPGRTEELSDCAGIRFLSIGNVVAFD